MINRNDFICWCLGKVGDNSRCKMARCWSKNCMLQKYSDKENCNSPLNSVIKMKATQWWWQRLDNTEGEREGISLEINIGYVLEDKKMYSLISHRLNRDNYLTCYLSIRNMDTWSDIMSTASTKSPFLITNGLHYLVVYVTKHRCSLRIMFIENQQEFLLKYVSDSASVREGWDLYLWQTPKGC